MAVSEKNCALGVASEGAAVSGGDDSAGAVEKHAPRHVRNGWSDIVAEAVSRGLLIAGGTYRLHGGCLRREAGR